MDTVESGIPQNFRLTKGKTMAAIFKRSRDKTRRRSCWYIGYDDEKGTRRTKKGFTDKRSTEDLALEIEREVKRKKEGLVDADNEKRRVAAETPILEHIGAFEKSISRNSGKHVKLTITRLKRLIAEAELKVIGDS